MFGAMIRPQKYFQTLTLIVKVVIQPYFGHLTFLMSTFEAQYGLDFKSKVVSGHDLIPKIFLDPNPDSIRAIIPYFGHLTLFVTVQVILRSNMTMTSRAKLFGSMVRPWKYFHTLLLYAYQSLEPFNPILAYQRTTYFALGDLFYDKREDFKTVF